MLMLRGFLVLMVFFLFGEALRVLFGLPVSAGVLGMILIAGFLMVWGRVSDSLAVASESFISVLVLLIMPGVVGVFFLADVFAGMWLAIGVALLLGTFLSVLTTLLLMRHFAPAASGGDTGE
ncbi:CidA/LrgA family protein [Marinobacter changyiensis]|uniref:CidA/LrgA family protein n=1 Tax=Marinobacter changyiensis TaxID=2604091 RepID=UPI0012654931|nr:CidA/LrgA family protein [Marinobacter changyiensis]